ncbi:MAG TPA: hypothetical protein VG895_03280 [Patescibacteria group bacterium]|nr:hypothetical protein [Patescibacteria group bacterium]
MSIDLEQYRQTLSDEFDLARSSGYLFPNSTVFLPGEESEEYVVDMINLIRTNDFSGVFEKVGEVLSDERFGRLKKAQDLEDAIQADELSIALEDQYGEDVFNLAYSVYDFIDLDKDIDASAK